MGRPVVYIAQSFGSLPRLDRFRVVVWITRVHPVAWIAPSFKSLVPCLDRSRSLRRLDRSVVCYDLDLSNKSPLFGSLRHLDRSVV